MGMLVRTAVLMNPLLLCNALLDLIGPGEIVGVWKGFNILPCTYVPVKDFVQQTVIWTVVHDQSSGTVFRRDDSGDHILLSEYRDRVSVVKNSPGNVSLHIWKLEISDRGTYTCQVTWKTSNNSLITNEITTRVEVVKVAVTKPIIRAGELGLMVPAGARTSLTCVATGSPPISYRWFLGEPGGKARLLGSQAELTFDSLRPSDSGKYYCEAENRVGARVAQQSDAVELTVRDLPTTTVALESGVGTSERYQTTTEKNPTELVFRGTSVIPWTPRGPTTVTDLPLTVMTSENDVGNPGKNHTTKDFQKTRLSLYLIILIAVVCGAVVFLIVFILCIRKPKSAHVYEVKLYNNSMRAEASSRFDSVGLYEEPISSTENNYVTEPMKSNRSEETNMKENKYDALGNAKESEYEVGDTV
ncbi:V-set and immunoglobulin domain-containing protein 4 isoform X1 [Struthio camelus]|uniref:V-set and immunoglobulin domain-containing protein 4 isoform X1 n=1 Tax=Struthio camelus TaxID=8801 RepID=UPI003603DFAA